MGLPENRPEDVWKRVAVGASDECWPWQGAVTGTGHGRFWIAGRPHGPHRVAYQLATGTDPGDLFVCHRCDNPPCCNPAHLFLGSARDNARDALKKGRLVFSLGERHG